MAFAWYKLAPVKTKTWSQSRKKCGGLFFSSLHGRLSYLASQSKLRGTRKASVRAYPGIMGLFVRARPMVLPKPKRKSISGKHSSRGEDDRRSNSQRDKKGRLENKDKGRELNKKPRIKTQPPERKKVRFNDEIEYQSIEDCTSVSDDGDGGGDGDGDDDSDGKSEQAEDDTIHFIGRSDMNSVVSSMMVYSINLSKEDTQFTKCAHGEEGIAGNHIVDH